MPKPRRHLDIRLSWLSKNCQPHAAPGNFDRVRQGGFANCGEYQGYAVHAIALWVESKSAADNYSRTSVR